MDSADKRLKVLHLDDDPDFLELFLARFSDSFDIVSIHDPDELFGLLNSHTFDGVILDYDLPVTNGNSLLQKIRSVMPWMPVFLLTGQGNEEVARQSFLNGASDYFTKEMAGIGARERLINSIHSHVGKAKIEKNFKDSQKLYQAIFESSGDAIALMEPGTGRLIDCNNAALEIFRCPRDKLIGRTPGDFSPPEQPGGMDSHQFAKEKVSKALSGIPQSFNWLHCHEDGSLFTVEVYLSRIDLQSSPLLLSVFRDITEQEKAKEKLRRSEERFRKLLENAIDPIIWTDIYGKILNCNQAAREMFERSYDDMVGSSVTTLHPMPPDQFNEAIYHQIVVSGDKHVNQVPVISASGKIRQVIITASKVNIDGKELVQGVFRDVTDELQAREEIKNRLDFEDLIIRFTARFINLPYEKIDQGIEEALQEIGRFSRCKLAGLLQLKGDPPVIRQTHVWRDNPSVPDMSMFEYSTPQDFPFYWDQLLNKGLIKISSMEDLPEDALVERAILDRYGFSPTLVIPLYRNEVLFGALGLSGEQNQHKEWKQSYIQLLRLAGEVIVSVLTRKESEDARMTGEKEKSEILDSLSEIVAYYPINSMKASWVNRTCLVQTGLKAEDFRTKNCYEIWHGSSERCPGCPVLQAFSTGKSQQNEISTPDGRIWLIKAHPVFDDDGIQKGVLEIGLDISQVKIAEEELALRDEQYRLLAENATDIITLHKMDGTYVFVSPSIEEITGYKPRELLGKKFLHCVHPDDSAMVMERFSKLMEDGGLVSATYRFRLKNGQYIWMESRGKLACDGSDGRPDTIAVISRDITLQQKVMDSLREEEEKFHKVFVLIQDGLFIVDEGHRIIEANPAGCQNHGYKEGELTGMMVEELIHPDYRESFMGMTNRLDMGLGFGGQVRCLRKDRANFDGEIYGTPCQLNHRLHFLTCIRDITWHNQLERELVKKNQELADFTYRVTHDIKNPLNIIKGYIASIDGKQELLEKYQDRIMSQADYLIGFVDKLLKLSRSGRIIDGKESVRILKIIRTAFALFRDRAPRARLEVLSEIPAVMGDPSGLEQVFTNLVENAFKYRDSDKDELVISLRAQNIGDRLIIELSDNGIGLENHLKDKIFEPGFTTSKDRGTGFGLVIVRKIIDAHGGEIYAESKGVGQGTTFVINLPALVPA